MLSTENPPSADPFPSETSQLKSGSCNPERASDDGGRQQQQLEEVDLTKYDSSPLPNFSIRDYVFNSRGKNITNHWPFSPKYLQLCLDHGVKDILPPFNSVIRSSTAEDIINSDVKGSGDHLLCVSSNSVCKKLVLDIDNIKSEDNKDKGNTLPTTSRSNSGGNSVPTIKTPYLEDPSAEKPETLVIWPVSDKVESNSQISGKKGRFLVKLSSVAEPKPNQELSVNTSVASETMASQVCPVCKIFSSSSNTTLNAHIDQCLSCESTVKWTANLNVVKHNIKPRKTRPMADIYAAALHCTLEDLDRRNGTNWALNPDLVPLKDKVGPQEKNCVSSSNKNDEGTVYVDSNGRKLRILSKFGDQQSDDDFLVPQNLDKTDKGSKRLPIKKEKYLVRRHELPNACDQMKSDDFGKMKQWVGSKRTGLRKKINVEDENQHPDKISKDLRSIGHSPSVANMFIKRKCDLNSKRKENLSFTPNDEYMEQHCVKNQDGYSLLTSQDSRHKKYCFMMSNCDVQSRKDGPSVRKHCSTDSSFGTEGHASSWSSKKIRRSSPDGNGDSSFIESRITQHDPVLSTGEKLGSPKKTASNHASLLGGNKLTSSRKNVLSVKHSLHSQLKKSGKKSLDHKKPAMHRVRRSDEEVATAPLPVVRGHDYPVVAPMVMKSRKGRAGFVSTGKEGDTVSNGSGIQREFGSDGAEKIGSLGAGDVSNAPDPVKEVGIRDDSKPSGGEACTMFGDSLESGSPGLAGLHNPKMNSQDYAKAYQEHSLNDLGEQESYSVKRVREGDVAREAHGSYFVDVDPILIPGPPGSFLPSPGHMVSEEFQGNSSLTTCRILSSEDDEHELVDMDTTSDSPVSATSFASNSIAVRSDSVSFANLAAQSHGGIQHGYSQRDISEGRMDPAVERCVPIDHQAAGVNEKVKIEANMIIQETTQAGTLKNDKPSCCSQEEEDVQNGSSSYHHAWECLRTQQTMTFLPPPPSQDCDQTDELRGSRKAAAAVAVSVSHNSEPDFPTYGDYESPSPSASSNSVLRLMGKNLMVLNKEENQNRPPQIVPSHSTTLGRFPFHKDTDTQTSTMAQYLDFGLPYQGSKFRTPELYPYHHPSRVVPKGTRDSLSAQPKELIILDNSPINDGRLPSIKAARGSKMVNNMEVDGQSSSVHNSSSRDSGHSNTCFSNYQTPSFSLHSGPQMVGWNHNPGGSSANAVPDSAPSTAGLRSSFYVSASDFRLT